MRLLVCEFVTGGGCAGGPLPGGLAREGDMMLRALAADLAELPGVRVAVTRDARLPADGLAAEVLPVPPGADPWAAWRGAMRGVDAVWPIAPETGGALERLTLLALEEGRTLLGSRPEAVRIAGSKRATAAVLAAAGVPTVPAREAAAALAEGLPPGPHGWVVKPDDGAGAEGVALVADAGEALRLLAAGEGRVVQAYVPGPAASVALLCRDGRARTLACNSQEVVARDGALRYRGGVVGGREERRADYARLADGVAAALPGLWGFAGVDLVDGADGPVAIEVNPRLTLSYAGLRAALGRNPAALVLDLLDRPLEALATGLEVRPIPVAVPGG